MKPTKEVMNISLGMLHINLDTMDPKTRKRQSLHLKPREVGAITEEQWRSRRIQKLLKAKFLVDKTAAHEKRKQREQELGLS
jgi:hypothetical protein